MPFTSQTQRYMEQANRMLESSPAKKQYYSQLIVIKKHFKKTLSSAEQVPGLTTPGEKMQLRKLLRKIEEALPANYSLHHLQNRFFSRSPEEANKRLNISPQQTENHLPLKPQTDVSALHASAVPQQPRALENSNLRSLAQKAESTLSFIAVSLEVQQRKREQSVADTFITPLLKLVKIITHERFFLLQATSHETPAPRELVALRTFLKQALNSHHKKVEQGKTLLTAEEQNELLGYIAKLKDIAQIKPPIPPLATISAASHPSAISRANLVLNTAASPRSNISGFSVLTPRHYRPAAPSPRVSFATCTAAHNTFRRALDECRDSLSHLSAPFKKWVTNLIYFEGIAHSGLMRLLENAPVSQAEITSLASHIHQLEKLVGEISELEKKQILSEKEVKVKAATSIALNCIKTLTNAFYKLYPVADSKTDSVAAHPSWSPRPRH